VSAQDITGVPGSPDATTTIETDPAASRGIRGHDQP
jgi:hypothetical protein